MTHSELIARFPAACSIAERVLLVPPEQILRLKGISVHECRVFILISKGTMTMDTGNDYTRITAGHFLDFLAWEPITFTDMTDDIEGWCLLPNYEFTNESLNDMKPANAESFKDRHSMPHVLLNDSDVRILDNQLQLLSNTLKDTGHFYRTELSQTYFRSFMLELGNLMLRKGHAAEESDGVVTRQDRILMDFLKLVWRFYREEHNIQFYSEKLCISSKHLSRVVSTKLGKTPYAVIRDEIIQQAGFLLKDTIMPVQEIASELHFSETAAFCKFFKKHSGISPTAFRKSGHDKSDQ